MSSDQTAAKVHIVIDKPINNMADGLVAMDAADFWDGTLLTPIGFDENAEAGGGANDFAWTGTTSTGEADSEHCQGWTSSQGGSIRGRRGRPDVTDTDWVDQSSSFCSLLRRLYCISQ